jgi:hypothetical protein
MQEQVILKSNQFVLYSRVGLTYKSWKQVYEFFCIERDKKQKHKHLKLPIAVRVRLFSFTAIL